MLYSDYLIRWWLFPTSVAFGAIFGMLTDEFFSPINIAGLSLGSLHLAYITALFFSFDLFLGLSSSTRLLALGLVVGCSMQAVGSYFSTGGLTISETYQHSFFSIVFILVMLLFYNILGLFGHGWTRKPVWPIANRLWRLRGTMILIMIFFLIRLCQLALLKLGIPNEARSLMIGTIEVHHLITGTILFIFLVPLCHSPLIKGHLISIVRILLIVSLALIADQASYLAIAELSDDSYFTLTSLFGGIIASSYGVVLLIFRPFSLSHSN